MFDEYKKGIVNKKKSRFTSIDQEASNLADLILEWNLNSDQKINWSQNKNLITHIEHNCNFKDAKRFFKGLFKPYQRKEDISFTTEQVVNLTKLEVFRDNPFIGLESIVVYICNNGISFDDQEALEKITMQDVLSQVDTEFGQKSFLCLRIFSKKHEHLVRFRTLENLA